MLDICIIVVAEVVEAVEFADIVVEVAEVELEFVVIFKHSFGHP